MLRTAPQQKVCLPMIPTKRRASSLRPKSARGNGCSARRSDARDGLLAFQIGTFHLVLGRPEKKGRRRRTLEWCSQLSGEQQHEGDEEGRSRLFLSLG